MGMRVLACFAMTSTACLGVGTPQGSLHGNIQGIPIDAAIDGSSRFVLERSSSCENPDESLFELSYGSSALAVDFRIAGGPTAYKTYPVPSPTGSGLLEFSTTPASGLSEVVVDMADARGRRTGHFHVTFTDATSVDGDFDLPFEARGTRPNCPVNDSLHFPDD